MSYGFLAGYHIPTAQSEVTEATVPPPPPPLEEQQLTVDIHNQYQNFNRYIPAGLQGTNYTPPPVSIPQKRKYDVGPGSSTKEPSDQPASYGSLVIFQGRDPSYPDELNKLIHPLHCALCFVQMNSAKSARDHYQSKQHDRHITSWLKTNYTDKAITAPTIKRFIKEGPTGPDAFQCDLCDLKFGSLAHANQHFAGRRHKLVANKISQPSGSGYYNAEHKWVRTSTKYVPNDDKDRRFGIGELFKYQQCVNEVAPTPEIATPTTEGIQCAIETAKNVSTSLFCEICKIAATSESQMTMHLQGIKHKKKLKALGLECTIEKSLTPSGIPAITVNGEGTILQSLQQNNPNVDLSMYRTPSGSYYCECCNMSMCHVAALQQHLIGKKHLKKVSEAKEKSKLKLN
uniref:Zinc finger protein 385D n=1 Tax=Ceratitis capitata TaxID=7213 RepID=W8CBV3_CERCA